MTLQITAAERRGKKNKGKLNNGPMLYQWVICSACLCLSAMGLSQWRGMGVGDITGVIKVGYIVGGKKKKKRRSLML